MDEVKLLDTIYAAAVDPEGWEPALDALRGAFRSEGANVELSHRARGPLLFRGLDLAGIDEYLAHYRSVCPRFALITQSNAGDVIHDAMLGDESALDRSEFYSDFLSRYDLRYHAAAVLQTSRGLLGYVAVHRRREAGSIQPEELTLFRRLVPHLDRALRVSMTLAQHRQRERDFRSAIDGVPTGVALLDARAHVLFVNAAATKLLASRGPLHIAQARLRARAPDERKTLRAQIGAALDDTPGPTGTVLYRGISTGGVTIGLTLTRLPSAERFDTFAQPVKGAALIATLSASDDSWHIRAEDFQGLDGLTKAEAEVVAALANGHTLREYAEQAGLSLHTVRTYMRQARERLRCHSQTQVIRRILDFLR